MEWLTLKAAISITTELQDGDLCACAQTFPELPSIVPLETDLASLCMAQAAGVYITGTATLTNMNVYSNTMEGMNSYSVLAFRPCIALSSIAPMERYVLGFWLAGRGTLDPGHGNTDQHQRVLESGYSGALTFCPCLDISFIAPLKC